MKPPERFPPDDPREWLNRARSNLIRALDPVVALLAALARAIPRSFTLSIQYRRDAAMTVFSQTAP